MTTKYYKNGNRYTVVSGEKFLQFTRRPTVDVLTTGENKFFISDCKECDVEITSEEFHSAAGEIWRDLKSAVLLLSDGL